MTHPPGKMRTQAILATIRNERKRREDEEKLRAAGVFPAAPSGVPGPQVNEVRVKDADRKRAEHQLDFK